MTCHHICACGAELRCNREPDKCLIGPTGVWRCDNCELDDYDAWIESQQERIDSLARMIARTQKKEKS